MIAIVTALVVLAHAAPAADSGVVIAAGTHIRAQLDQPLPTSTAVDSDIVMRVSHDVRVGPGVALPAKPATTPRSCFVAGTPGTPDITIPGFPPIIGADGTPESPGTPTLVLPGIPAMPDSWVPC